MIRAAVLTDSEGYIMEKKDRVVERQSNIELLRIVAMLMIVAYHFGVHGGFKFSTQTITINRLWIQFIQIGGKIGVNIFVLISGYYLVHAVNLKWNKLIKLWLQMFMYSVVIFCILAIPEGDLQFKQLIRCLLPITYSHWWFASTYFAMVLFSPYINKFLHTLEKKNYQRLLILLTFCWCIIPTFLASTWQCNYLLWFFYLYAVAGYVRIYDLKWNINCRMCITISLILIVLTFLCIIILDCIGRKIPIVGIHAMYFCNMQRLPTPVIAFLMFLGFGKMHISYSKVINVISSATFGVYLIHDDSYMRQFIWGKLYKNSSFGESSILIPYSIMVIALVYIVCTGIELLRINLIEKHYVKFVNRIADMVNSCINNLGDNQ